jgi:hypothetical protein
MKNPGQFWVKINTFAAPCTSNRSSVEADVCIICIVGLCNKTEDCATTFSDSHVLGQTKRRLLDPVPGFAAETLSAAELTSLTAEVDRNTVRGVRLPELVLQMSVL